MAVGHLGECQEAGVIEPHMSGGKHNTPKATKAQEQVPLGKRLNIPNISPLQWPHPSWPMTHSQA